MPKKVVDLFQFAANTVNAISKSEKEAIISNTKDFFSTLQTITNSLTQHLNEISEDNPINNNVDEARSKFRIEKLKVEQVVEEIDCLLDFAEDFCNKNDMKHLLVK